MEQMQTTATTQSGTSRREERHMASSINSTTSIHELDVRKFAAEFSTPNVLRAVALCESGQLSWAEVHEIFKASLATGIKAVS